MSKSLDSRHQLRGLPPYLQHPDRSSGGNAAGDDTLLCSPLATPLKLGEAGLKGISTRGRSGDRNLSPDYPDFEDL